MTILSFSHFGDFNTYIIITTWVKFFGIRPLKA